MQSKHQIEIHNYKEIKCKSKIRNKLQWELSDPLALRFDFEDKTVAIACSDGKVRVFSLINNMLSSQINLCRKQQIMPVTCVRWKPIAQSQFNLQQAGHILVSFSNGKNYEVHARSGKIIYEFSEPDNYNNIIDFSPVGNLLAATGKDCIIRIYNQRYQKVAQLFGVDWHKSGHNNRLFGLKWINQNLILSGGWDNNVHKWDIRIKESIGCICGPKVCGDTIDYKQNIIVIGAHRADQSIELYDQRMMKLLFKIEWDRKVKGSFIFGCQFSKVLNNVLVGGCSGLNQFKVFHYDDNKWQDLVVARNKKPIYCVDNGNKSNKIAFGSGESTVYVMDLIFD